MLCGNYDPVMISNLCYGSYVWWSQVNGDVNKNFYE